MYVHQSFFDIIDTKSVSFSESQKTLENKVSLWMDEVLQKERESNENTYLNIINYVFNSRFIENGKIMIIVCVVGQIRIEEDI